MLTISAELQARLQEQAYRIVDSVKVIGGTNVQFAHIEKTQKNLKYNSISRNYGNTLKPKDGGLHL